MLVVAVAAVLFKGGAIDWCDAEAQRSPSALASCLAGPEAPFTRFSPHVFLGGKGWARQEGGDTGYGVDAIRDEV